MIELERLATAVWIRNREHVTDPREVAQRIHELKPHISLPDAEEADRLVTTALMLTPTPSP